MPTPFSVLLMLVLACALSAAAVEPAAPAPRFEAAELAAIHTGLDQRWHRYAADPQPGLGVRELFGAIFEAMGSGWHPERIDHLLDLADRFQDADPASPGYGNFRWTFSDPKVLDRNAVEFCMQQAALGWWFYREALPEPARAHLRKILALAAEGVRRHVVRESYTNIFVMKSWNCIALGEALDDAALAEEGYRLFDRWLVDVWNEGIHEYLSPTYTGVDLDSLALLARYPHRDEGRSAAAAALRLMWTDLAANWFAPGERLGGAHSRDYDYLTGHGMLEGQLASAGWLGPDAVPASGGPGVFWRFSRCPPPPAGLRERIATAPRTVIDRWGPQSWERAVDHLGKGFCLGSSGATYANMDKPLTMSWAGARTPMMNLVMDGRGDPYGANRIPETSGAHQKSLHLVPFISSVQRQAEVLFAASIDMAAKNVGHDKAALTTLAAQLVLPLMDEVWIGGSRVEPGADAAGATLAVLRKGDVALGVRVLLAIGEDGRPAPTALVNDGKDAGACRLATTLAAGKPSGRGTVVLFLRAAEGLDAAGFAAFRAAFAATAAEARLDRDLLDARAAGLHGELHLAADLAKGMRLANEGGEPGLAEALLTVDGAELGRGILEGLPAIRAAKP
jgi:hypothetical protein